MRISELSELVGVPVPTIKYYLREGLLASGERTAPNQAQYGEAHLDRLQLIRALRDVGDLSIDQVRRVLAAVDGRGPGGSQFVGMAIDALSERGGPARERTAEEEAAMAGALSAVEEILAQLGWRVREDCAAKRDLAEAMAAIARLRPQAGEASVEGLSAYIRAAEVISASEIPEDWDPASAPASALEYAVMGTVLFEPVILSLRRLANESRTLAIGERRGAGPGHT